MLRARLLSCVRLFVTPWTVARQSSRGKASLGDCHVSRDGKESQRGEDIRGEESMASTGNSGGGAWLRPGCEGGALRNEAGARRAGQIVEGLSAVLRSLDFIQRL